MRIPFFKYQGTGNDFVIIDNSNNDYDALTLDHVKHLCDRRFGIGADGLMLLNLQPGYDFKMVYFNSDGKEGSMCGNGGRCLVKFAFDQGIVKTNYSFIAMDGVHEATIDLQGHVSLKMNDVDQVISENDHFLLNTGSPHYIESCDDLTLVDILKSGRKIRYSPAFEKEGINVNFVQQLDEPYKIAVRTYERGVEDETYSCGTGVTAAALVHYHNEIGFNEVVVETKGGILSVHYEKDGDAYKNIWLTGPAEKVFEGTIELKD